MSLWISELTGISSITLLSLFFNIVFSVIIIAMISNNFSSKDNRTVTNKPVDVEKRSKRMEDIQYNSDGTCTEIHTSCRGFQYSVIKDATGKLLYYGDNKGKQICYI